MRITALFESWFIGDGTYPPLDRGQRVNLSFEMQTQEIAAAESSFPFALVHDAAATYRFSARVLRVYDDVTVLETDDLRFYVDRALDAQPGDVVSGKGELAFDYYCWVERLERYPDPPDLFYQLRVERILRVRIPERFMFRHARGKSGPASLRPGDYGTEDVAELQTMHGQAFDEEFYLIELSDEDLGDPVPLTFT